MRRDPNDDVDDPFDDLFRQMERMMSEFAEEMNEAMGPRGGFAASSGEWGRGPSSRGGHDLHVDFQESEDELRVVADLPGAAKEDLEVQSNGEVLSIRSSGGRRYDERVRLPVRVDETSATASYRNGVLEVTFDRADADDGTRIDVD
jgi:HSP20 family protein